MQVILLKDVEKLGKRGEIVAVRGGFGRNFLLPQALAMLVTRENRAAIESEKKEAARRDSRKKEGAQKLASRLESLHLRLPVAVGEKDKLFGSVTGKDLAEALEREGVSVDKKQFLLSEPIKSLGSHSVKVELGPDVKATLQVEVVKKS